MRCLFMRKKPYCIEAFSNGLMLPDVRELTGLLFVAIARSGIAFAAVPASRVRQLRLNTNAEWRYLMQYPNVRWCINKCQQLIFFHFPDIIAIYKPGHLTVSCQTTILAARQVHVAFVDASGSRTSW